MTTKHVYCMVAMIAITIVGLASCSPTQSTEGNRKLSETTEWVPVGFPQESKVPDPSNYVDDEDVANDDDAADAEDNDVGDVEEDETTTMPSDNSLAAVTESPESKILQTAMKKEKLKSPRINKKMAMQLLPLLLIPLMIQAQLIPLMLFKLKMMALKALMVGKAALIIVLINVLRNAFIGADSMEEQYEQQTLASSHYGYSGGPEYGAWVNKRRRIFVVPSSSEALTADSDPYRGHQNVPSHSQATKMIKYRVDDPKTSGGIRYKLRNVSNEDDRHNLTETEITSEENT